MWSIDNFGDKAICLIVDGECFEWNSAATNATNSRATIITNAPTASRHMLVSTPDRHLVFFGTETTIGDKSTQDDMFIRFSAKKILIRTHLQQPMMLVHRDWPTDHGSWELLEVEMQSMYIQIQLCSYKDFVGQPFTFAFVQAGTNCGLQVRTQRLK